MTASLLPWPRAKFFSPNTNFPLAGGKVYTYAAGTNTPLATYTDSSQGVANTNPVILDAQGEANIWLGSGLNYKIDLFDASNVHIAGYPIDNISGADVLIATAIAQLRADLASSISNTLGAGMVGWSSALTYPSNTVGLELKTLATESARVGSLATTCGRLSNLITDGIGDPFTQCHFIPYNGHTILVNGVQEIIPDGVLAASGGINGNYQNCYINSTPGQSLTAGFWFIYVKKISGSLVMSFSATGYVQNGPTWGNATKIGDESSTLIGICNIKLVDRGDGHGSVPTTFGGAHGQTISGYFNRFRTSLFSQVTGGAVTSTTLTALPNGATVLGMPSSNYMEWVQWYDDAPTLYYNANSGNPTSVGALLTLDMGVNSTTTGFSASQARAVTADQQCIPIPGRGQQVDATGHYYAQMLYKTSAGAAYFEGLCWADGVML